MRYHGLDGLRGFAMLLGIVLHGSLPYFSRSIGIESFWPSDDDQSWKIFFLFDFIHVWRMPAFFLLAGFFACLLVNRHSTVAFARNRLCRVVIPFAIFAPIMAITLPVIWIYGWYGTISTETLTSILMDRRSPDLSADGDLIGHLWFLWYLLLLYLPILIFHPLSKLNPTILISATACAIILAILSFFLLDVTSRDNYLAYLFAATGLVSILVLFTNSFIYLGRLTRNSFTSTYEGILEKLLYSRLPIILILIASVLLVLRAGDESKPVLPLNIADLAYHGLFFYYGYGLFHNKKLITNLKSRVSLISIFSVAVIAQLFHIITLDPKSDNVAIYIQHISSASAAVLFTFGFIGLFERIISTQIGWVRWLSDSAYWIYLIHLPVVAAITFWLAHVDRSGLLMQVTSVDWNADTKFLAACIATTIICMSSYKYLVRNTIVGKLLNGSRTNAT